MPAIPENMCIESGKGTAFCYPERYQTNPKDNRFIYAVSAERNPDELIRDVFQERSAAVKPLPKLTDLSDQNKTWRFYDVTGALPPQVQELLWRDGRYPGPNCYGSALATRLTEFGLRDYIGDRYVSDNEAEFLLALFFQPVPSFDCEKISGGMVVYEQGSRLSFVPGQQRDSTRFMNEKFYYEMRRHPEILTQKHVVNFNARSEEQFRHAGLPMKKFSYLPLYSAGEHMAYSLGATAVFHKLNFYMGDGYKIDSSSEAPKRMEAASDLRNRDKFERRSDPFKPSNFSMACFMLDPRRVDSKGQIRLPHEKANIPPERREYFLKLLGFYADRIRMVERAFTPGNYGDTVFDRVRPSLLTVETFWQILREFNKEIGSDPKNALQLDWELASTYYKASSLSQELRAMSDEYFPIKESNTERRLNEMYEKYYFRFDDSFRAEVNVHLDVRKIPQGLWDDIYKVLTENLAKKYHPLDFAQTNGSRGAPFVSELEAAITQCSSR